MIPVAEEHRWLLGFCWRDQYYTEKCLPFGLRTAPFLFNMFAEAFHWILLASSTPAWRLQIVHYLDDFVSILPAQTDPSPVSCQYTEIASFLGLQDNAKKAATGTLVECLGIEIDTTTMTARLPASKIVKGTYLVENARANGYLTQRATEKLTGFLSFCTTVIPFGRTFIARL
jgi:hypothetical protein